MAREDEEFRYDKFVVGKKYERISAMELGEVKMPNQPRDITGITRFKNSIVLFVTLDKSNKEKAHKYNDTFLLDGKRFFWESQNTNTPTTPAIKNIMDGFPSILFVRIKDKVKGATQPFIYAGRLKYIEHNSSRPVEVLFEVQDYQEKPNKGLGEIYAWSKNTELLYEDELPQALRKVKNSAQGRMTDAKKKKAIELHAMSTATAHYYSLGYEVIDTSSNCPYDLECYKDSSFRRVEVKGTTSTGNFVTVTKNEVQDALSDTCETDLFILTNINITVIKAGEYATSDGDIRCITNWKPDSKDLEPTTFRYKVD